MPPILTQPQAQDILNAMRTLHGMGTDEVRLTFPPAPGTRVYADSVDLRGEILVRISIYSAVNAEDNRVERYPGHDALAEAYGLLTTL